MDSFSTQIVDRNEEVGSMIPRVFLQISPPTLRKRRPTIVDPLFSRSFKLLFMVMFGASLIRDVERKTQEVIQTPLIKTRWQTCHLIIKPFRCP